MKKILIALLTITTLWGSGDEFSISNYLKDNFLKYSTFYTSVSLASPFTPAQKFDFDQESGTFVETTEEVEGSYNVSFGVRKLARFKYQAKGKKFYDGSEKELSDVSTIGAVSGWEYLVKYSSIRSFGEEFVDTESWVRYLGDNFVIKGAYANSHHCPSESVNQSLNGNNPYAGCPLRFPPTVKFQLFPTGFLHLASNWPNSRSSLPKFTYEPLITKLSPKYLTHDSESTNSSPNERTFDHLIKYSQPETPPIVATSERFFSLPS